jgi:hypothetical protein
MNLSALRARRPIAQGRSLCSFLLEAESDLENIVRLEGSGQLKVQYY